MKYIKFTCVDNGTELIGKLHKVFSIGEYSAEFNSFVIFKNTLLPPFPIVEIVKNFEYFLPNDIAKDLPTHINLRRFVGEKVYILNIPSQKEIDKYERTISTNRFDL